MYFYFYNNNFYILFNYYNNYVILNDCYKYLDYLLFSVIFSYFKLVYTYFLLNCYDNNYFLHYLSN